MTTEPQRRWAMEDLLAGHGQRGRAEAGRVMHTNQVGPPLPGLPLADRTVLLNDRSAMLRAAGFPPRVGG